MYMYIYILRCISFTSCISLKMRPWQDPTAPYKQGVYILVRAAYVAPDADNFAPDDDELVARVEEGEDSLRIDEQVDGPTKLANTDAFQG